MKCTCSTTSTKRLPVATRLAYVTAPAIATPTPVNRHVRRSRIRTSATITAATTAITIAPPTISRNWPGKAASIAERRSPTNAEEAISARPAAIATISRRVLTTRSAARAGPDAANVRKRPRHQSDIDCVEDDRRDGQHLCDRERLDHHDAQHKLAEPADRPDERQNAERAAGARALLPQCVESSARLGIAAG